MCESIRFVKARICASIRSSLAFSSSVTASPNPVDQLRHHMAGRAGRLLPGFASSLLVGSLLAAFVIGGSAILGVW